VNLESVISSKPNKYINSLTKPDDTDQAIRTHCKNIETIVNLVSPVDLTGLDFSQITTPNNYKTIKLIPEGDVWRLIIKSRLPEAEKIEKWIMEDVLPSIRKTGSYSTQKQTPIFDTSSFSSEKLLDVQKTLLGLETAIKILKVSEASKLLMTETIYRELGIKTDFLPKYSDEKHTYSLTHLLKKFGSKLSAQKVNQKLLEIGILEIKTRKSRQIKKETYQMLLALEFNNIDENIKSETIREFKSLTEKGLKFGKNLINPNNELQTQPHYFESSFAELLNLI
jgi:prophage antirepressor-like protein